MKNLVDAKEVPTPISYEAPKSTSDFRSELIAKTVALAKHQAEEKQEKLLHPLSSGLFGNGNSQDDSFLKQFDMRGLDLPEELKQ